MLLAMLLWEGTDLRANPVVLVAGDLRGEIKPCGCSVKGQMGGLQRRMTYLAGLREEAGAGQPVWVLDLGNNFPEPSPQGGLKVDLIQEMLAAMGTTAILPGPNELAFGVERLATNLPYLLSNDAEGNRFLPFLSLGEGPEKTGVYGYLSPGLVYQKSQSHFRLEEVARPLIKRLRDNLRDEGHQRAILLFRGNDQELAAFQVTGDFDLIVSGNPFADELNQVTGRSTSLGSVPMVPTKGQGVFRFALGARAADAKPDGGALDWLDGRYADHPRSLDAFVRYDAKVKEMFLARLTAMEAHRQESPFSGAAPCAACHRAADSVWKASRHAGAIATLERVGKSYDPECLACHVVGLGQGGYLSADLTPELGGVKCENCHGAGKRHVANPQQPMGPVPSTAPGTHGKPDADTCILCHRGSHSPEFDFARYWPKIRHTK